MYVLLRMYVCCYELVLNGELRVCEGKTERAVYMCASLYRMVRCVFEREREEEFCMSVRLCIEW